MRNSQSDAPELSSLALRQYQANFRPERVRVLCAPLANVGCLKTGKCRFAAAPAKAGAYVGQQVVGIGFSRCVREAQVSEGVQGFLAPLQGAGLEKDPFSTSG